MAFAPRTEAPSMAQAVAGLFPSGAAPGTNYPLARADICKNKQSYGDVTRVRFYDTDIVFLAKDPFGDAGVGADRATTAKYDVVATHHHGSYFVEFSCHGVLGYTAFIKALYQGPRTVLKATIENFAHKFVLRGAQQC